ncbi:YkvI family membrane protein [Caldisericum sp.]|jgi:uncharacterized membrane protein YkvI|uniref:YkvI family membrane protein n=1 Tax=Caldisericum sp. TaxID=2499687 RepID=UPI003D0EF8AD
MGMKPVVTKNVWKMLGFGVAFEVAALAFSTHVGGGFALGTQEMQYFVRFGKSTFYLPLFSMLLLSLTFYFAWEYQMIKGISSYKEFFEEFYGRSLGRGFMVLYDIVFSIMVILATGAALAGMANVLRVFHINISLYWGYLFAAIVVYIIASFGLKGVLANASFMSLGIIIIIILLAIFSLPKALPSLSNLPSTPLFGPSFFQSPFWFALLYTGFQSSIIGSYINGAVVLKTDKQVKTAAILSFLMNGIMLTLMCLAIAGSYEKALKDPTPTLVVLSTMHPVFSYLYGIMLFFALITTAVSLVYASAKRWMPYGANSKGRWGDENFRFKVWIVIWVILSYAISNSGIVAIVKKGYGFFGYIAIAIIVLPILILGPSKIAKARKEAEVKN